MKNHQVFVMVFGLAAPLSFPLAQVSKSESQVAQTTTDFVSVHSMISPNEIKWVAAPPKLPKGAQFAVLHGDRTKSGASYAFRAKLPDGYSVPPHWHSMDEHITVIQGTMRLGMGEKFDPAKLRDLPAGSYAVLPKGQPHFNLYQGETIIQLHGIGPCDIHYVNPVDDPSVNTR